MIVEPTGDSHAFDVESFKGFDCFPFFDLLLRSIDSWNKAMNCLTILE